MENIKQLRIRCVPFDGIEGKVIFVHTIEDGRKGEVFLLKNGAVSFVDLINYQETIIKDDIGEILITIPMISQSAVTLCTANKFMILNCLSKEFYQMNFEKEIETIGWNQVNDYVVVVFKDKTMRIYSFDARLDLILEGEGDLTTPGPDMETIGWGLASTQFQGPMVPTSSDDVVHTSPVKTEEIFISWRGNNEAFLVSFIEKDKRIFKVFNYSSDVIGICEDKGELNGPISWKPQGNVIAASMYLDNKNCIGLFEKNGQFRMQFPLVDIFCPIILLSWSPCGAVLSVVQKDETSTHVSFYITSNSRWYLKQHFFYNETNVFDNLTWLSAEPRCYEIAVISKGSFCRYKFKFGFDVDHRNNILAAVNGKSLFVHEFGKSIDPPPTFSKNIELENPINMVAFHSSMDLAVVLDSSNVLYCFTVEEFDLNLISRTKLADDTFPLALHHLFWGSERPYVIQEVPLDKCAILYEFNTSDNILVETKKFDVSLYPIEHILSINHNMIIHTQKHKIVYKNEQEPIISVNVPFPHQVIPYMFHSDLLCSFILTADGEFYIDEELISKNITSMMIYRNYLFLTSGSLLCTTKLKPDSLDSLTCYSISQFHVRPVNESAFLVCMAGNSTNVVLHTPRGNLGIVSCRNMEIEILEKMLRRGKWGDAITYMRMSRLNWNLLIDLNPDRFYENLSKIVFECNSRNILNSIVGDINDDNTLNTIYAKTIDILYRTSLNKRKTFLTRLGDFLDETGAFSQYLPTVIKICIDTNEIQKALSYASTLINSESLDGVIKAEQAISLLKIQVQPEDLFKGALQLFDLKLADFISKKCQMNPLEVDPILEGLKKMSDLEKRISIHVKYQNWDEAISYMLRKEELDKDETLQFISDHSVEKKAYIESLKANVPFKDDIAIMYVNRLIENGCHDEAALIYIHLQRYNEAMEQFKLCYDYQKSIEYLPYATLDENGRAEYFTDFANRMIGVGHYSEAARMYEDQLGDITKAVTTLVSGREFKEAFRIARKYGLDDVIDLHVIPKILDTLEMTLDQVQETTEKFKKYCERLKKLRMTKKYYYGQLKKNTGRIRGSGDAPDSVTSFQQSKMASQYGHYTHDIEVKSIISTESHKSSRSSTSSSTTMTQKTIRKLERLKTDLSEGSRFEDIALMRELHIMIAATFRSGIELREIFLRLIEYNVIDINSLKIYQTKMYNLQQLMVDEVCNIWDIDFTEESTKRYINENFVYMDEQYRTIPSEILDPISFAWTLEMLKD